ncbi:MAG: HEPN domain-containing protein [Clostridia bacterium]|nr:HEPN domain-containing protein [Clostridia bacterium]
MNNLEKYKYWIQYANYDLETAEAMLKSKRYVYVAFTCQQAIEKAVKALHVLYTGNEAPKSHNILYVFELIFNNEEYCNNISDEHFEEDKEKYKPLFTTLHSYYIAERYTDYKRQVSESLGEENSKDLLDKTKEAFKWLESLKQYWN